MPNKRRSGVTLQEMIVLFSAIVILIAILARVPFGMFGGEAKHSALKVLNNMRRLHLVTQQMALDGLTTGNTNIGWPGDTGGSFSNWARQLTSGYLKTNEFCEFLSSPETIVQPDTIPLPDKAALLVYAVKEISSGDTVFLTTVNFTNSPTGGQPLMVGAKPFENRFVVFRKGGDGAILLPNQVGQTNSIGTFVPPCEP